MVSDWLPLTNAVELVQTPVHGPMARTGLAARPGAADLRRRRVLGRTGV